MSERAVTVLEKVKKRIEDGQWVKGMWACGERACLHAHVNREIRRVAGSAQDPLDVEVYWLVWNALPEWAGRDIPVFNDDVSTTEAGVLAVLDKALTEARKSEC